MTNALKIASLCACAGLRALPATAQTPVPGPVVPGIEVSLESPPPSLVGKRIGLITNQTGIDRQGRGDVPPGGAVNEERDPSGLPVYSIYGGDNAPTQNMLEGLGALFYDMQDLGVRQYTTESTMLLSIRWRAAQVSPWGSWRGSITRN